ncbi:hypothetical protein LINPERHAP2_LOCUS7458 [Linum perenne]
MFAASLICGLTVLASLGQEIIFWFGWIELLLMITGLTFSLNPWCFTFID